MCNTWLLVSLLSFKIFYLFSFETYLFNSKKSRKSYSLHSFFSSSSVFIYLFVLILLFLLISHPLFLFCVQGPQYEAAVQSLMALGFERPMVVSALRASFNNPDRAAEYLFTVGDVLKLVEIFWTYFCREFLKGLWHPLSLSQMLLMPSKQFRLPVCSIVLMIKYTYQIILIMITQRKWYHFDIFAIWKVSNTQWNQQIVIILTLLKGWIFNVLLSSKF